MANTLKFGNGEWATKEGSALAYNDENGNFKPLPFDFTRASSATRVGRDGLIETVGSNTPRVDFKDDSNGALKLEPQRSNLIAYSEDFSESIWTNTGASTSVNPIADLSPDGNLTGNEFNEGSSDGRRGVYEDISVSANQSHTLSVFVKKGTSNLFRIVIAENGDALNWVALQVDLSDNSLTTDNGSNNSFTDISSSISDSDYNGYYRLTLTAKHTTVTSLRLLFNMTQSAIASSNSYGRADYTGTNKTVFVWGCQLESNSSYPTSYIPTQGSQVTRVADACSQTPPSGIIGQTEGTVFVDFEFNYSDSNTQVLLKANQSSDANSVGIEILGTTIKGLVNSQSLNIANIQGTIAIGKIKAAIAYKTNDIAFYVNGVQLGIISSGSIDFAGVVDILTIGHFSLNGGLYFPSSRPFNQAQLYNTRLSNAELQALTTI